jgi:hypothetical protein
MLGEKTPVKIPQHFSSTAFVYSPAKPVGKLIDL